MLRKILKLSVLTLLLAGVQRAAAFSMIGDYETWQQPVVSFRVGSQLGGSRNLGDEFRLNSPIITYAFDSTFLDYFGTDGVRAVDEAFKVLNQLPTASKASLNLTEFLTDDAIRIRASAEALNLLDLKSATLYLMMEQMGLYGERHVFDLRQRSPKDGTCQFNYTVINRNFDPITFEPTHFVNGTLYSYTIVDLCPVRSEADAIEFPVDPTDFTANAVATGGVGPGSYYLGLTRDDFGGLRYLYNRNNLNYESLSPDAYPQASAGPWTPVGILGTNSLASTNDTAALRGGVEKFRFKKVKFDSWYGAYFKPQVLSYSLPYWYNGKLIKQTIKRVIYQPDIVFTAADIADESPSAVPFSNPIGSRSMNYTNVPPFFQSNNNGPGTIYPQKVITFNKLGPFFQNTTDFFLDEATGSKGFIWGSFDGTTNDPIVFPQGSSIRALEAQALHH